MRFIKILFGLFLLAIIAGIGYFAIQMHWYGFSASAKPSAMEEMMARNARKIATPAKAKQMKNPNAVTDKSMGEAREHFVEHCSVCHGIDGRGKTIIGQNLYPKAPDMTDSDTQQLSDGELFYIISNGVRFTGMPAWGSADTPESIWDLVALVRHLPQLSPSELKSMKEISERSGAHHEEHGESHATSGEGSETKHEHKHK